MRAMWLAGLGTMALMAASPDAAQASEGCKAIAGADQLLQRPDLRWLIVGELHGTTELPDAFADLVCLAASAGKPVTVGLEFPQSEQARFDAYMASTGDAAARAALLQGATWRQPLRDGRSSQAMLALVDRLRLMKAAGQVARVLAIRKEVAFTQGQPFDAAAGEAAIGDGMREAGSADGLTLILIGNVHAALQTFGNLAYPPAASSLPSGQTLTLNFAYAGGSAWNCVMPGAGGQLTCEARSMGMAPEPGARRIALGESPGMPWSGTFDIGAPVTASPPAVPEAGAAAAVVAIR